MTKLELKNILISILIGAIVAFLATLFQGLLDFLRSIDVGNPGPISAAILYLARK